MIPRMPACLWAPPAQAASVEWLVVKGCSVAATSSEGTAQLSPLHAAAMSADPDTIGVLLKLGAYTLCPPPFAAR